VTSDGLGNVFPSISGDGRSVAYVRRGQTKPYDIYLWRRGEGQSVRVTHGNHSSSQPDLSADGRWLAFTSAASDLVDRDQNHRSDVFLWRTDSEVEGVRRLTHGWSASENATVSSSGRFVAFLWTGRLEAGKYGSYGAYLLDRQTGSTRLVSLASRRVRSAEVSDNGHHVVYWLASGAAPLSRALIWDRNTGNSTMVAADKPWTPYRPRVSSDGSHVVYDGGDPDPVYPVDVYLWDRIN